MDASISVSAQFGGRDAAAALLPHFRALKRAASGCVIPNFPCGQLAFILRVDGDINTFDDPGVGHLEIDRQGTYVSLDIGITRKDRAVLAHDHVKNPIVIAILAASDLLRAAKPFSRQLDLGTLETALERFADAYRNELNAPE